MAKASLDVLPSAEFDVSTIVMLTESSNIEPSTYTVDMKTADESREPIFCIEVAEETIAGLEQSSEGRRGLSKTVTDEALPSLMSIPLNNNELGMKSKPASIPPLFEE